MIKRQWGLVWQVGSGGFFEGGLLKICRSRMGAYSRGGLIGGQFEGLRHLTEKI